MNGIRNVFCLSDYERDPAKYMQRLLAEANRRTAAQAEQSSRTAEQMRGYEAWGRNRKQETPNDAA